MDIHGLYWKLRSTYLYKFLKSKSKNSSKVGPFKNNKNTAEALRTQYKSVFSKPSNINLIDDPDLFFNVNENKGNKYTYENSCKLNSHTINKCDLCEKTIVHECDQDIPMNNECDNCENEVHHLYNLHNHMRNKLKRVFISEEEIKKSISKLPNTTHVALMGSQQFSLKNVKTLLLYHWSCFGIPQWRLGSSLRGWGMRSSSQY